jgi:hypothetical protein
VYPSATASVTIASWFWWNGFQRLMALFRGQNHSIPLMHCIWACNNFHTNMFLKLVCKRDSRDLKAPTNYSRANALISKCTNFDLISSQLEKYHCSRKRGLIGLRDPLLGTRGWPLIFSVPPVNPTTWGIMYLNTR